MRSNLFTSDLILTQTDGRRKHSLHNLQRGGPRPVSDVPSLSAGSSPLGLKHSTDEGQDEPSDECLEADLHDEDTDQLTVSEPALGLLSDPAAIS